MTALHFDRILTSHEEDVLSIMRRVSQSTLEKQLASLKHKFTSGLDQGMLYVELTPHNPQSAKLGVQVDSEELVTLYIGAYGTLVECFSKDSNALRGMIESYASAVIAGDYEEWVRVHHTRDGAIGLLWVDGRTICIRYNTMHPAWWVKRRWRHINYQPYGP